MRTLFEQLMELRDAQRERARRGVLIIDGEQLPWELTPIGKIRWYMHPLLDDRAFNSFLFYLQEIPPGSCSGRQFHQGGQVVFILAGRGHTVIDGVRHDWMADDLLQIPLRPKGVTFQHFNDSDEEPVQFLACEPNVALALGVDRGCGYEVLQPCPEYLARGRDPRPTGGSGSDAAQG